jgi:hypothetical protein
MARAIFISYRRDDTEGEAGRLFDDLSRTLGENSVFMDVTGINPGVDFRKAIDDNVATCGALLAVIGRDWATLTDSSGTRRLDDPNDFVRLEIASALKRDVAVIPVLVHEAKMPRPDQLPENLKDLAFRNSVELSHTRWASDVELLIKALTRYVDPPGATANTRASLAAPARPLPRVVREAQPDSARPSKLPLLLGIAAVAVLALGFGAYKIFNPATIVNPTPAPATVGVTPAPSPASPAAATDKGKSAGLNNENAAQSTLMPTNSSAFLGDWINPSPEGQNGMYWIEIQLEGDHLSVHAWGNCVPNVCNWGKVPGTFRDGQIWAEWNLGQKLPGEKSSRNVRASFRPTDGQVIVNVTNTYANRPSNQRQLTFVRKQ